MSTSTTPALVKRRSPLFLISVGLMLLFGGQLAMFRNPQNIAMSLPIATMAIGLLLFLIGAQRAIVVTPETNADPSDLPASSDSTQVRIKRIPLALSLGLLLFTVYRTVQPGVSFWEQLTSWLLAIGALYFAIKPLPVKSAAEPSKNRIEVAIVAALLIGGLLMHIPGLGSTPYMMDQDEAGFANQGVSVYAKHFAVSPFAPGVQSHPYLFQGLIGLSIAIFGQTLFAARLISAIMAAAGVLAVYMLGRELFGRRVALFGALFLLTWPLHILFARLAMNQPADPLFTTLAFYFLVRGLRRSAARDFVACGVLMGVAQLFYLGGRLAPLVLIAYVVYVGLRSPHVIRQCWQGLLIMTLTFAFTALPQHFYALYFHLPLTTRAWVSVLGGQFDPRYSAYVGGLYDQLYRSFFALFTVPDTNWYGSSSNLLNFTGGPLLLVGVGVSLVRCWRQPRYVLPLGWTLAVILSGSTLSLFPPQYQRYYPAVSAFALLIGIGGAAVAETIVWALNRLKEQRDFTYACAGLIALFNLLFFIAVYVPERGYFANRPNQITNRIATMMRSAADEGRQVVLYRNPIVYSKEGFVIGDTSPGIYVSVGMDNTPVIRYLMRGSPYQFFYDRLTADAAFPVDPSHPFAIFVPFAERDALQSMVAAHPVGVLSLVNLLENDTPAFLLYKSP